MRGCRAFVSHVPNYYPEFIWKVRDLLEAGEYKEAQSLHDSFMIPYSRLVGQIAGVTAGESVFVRPFMKAVGLNGGHSRRPSRDEGITSELQAEIKLLIDQIAVLDNRS